VIPKEISTQEAAALLEITPHRLRQLIAEGHIAQAKRAKVGLVGAVQGYIRFLKDDTRRSSKSASASRVQDARAREIDLKIAEREGRLIDAVEHRDLFAESFGIIKSGLDSIPARVTRDMALRRKIETEIDDVLRRAADRFEQAARDPALAGEPAEADGGDDA
jgi:phage terminase Nu1 subunit (DNA packaging protein)